MTKKKNSAHDQPAYWKLTKEKQARGSSLGGKRVHMVGKPAGHPVTYGAIWGGSLAKYRPDIAVVSD
ncbi:hypothetical protein GOB93_14175 [Acetobacter musti]|uniref:Uncharacterized protein n=1 Tax=Acetobacter musti TaxID=864732 RepID=A0ABX0JTB7_9PROT|nr:hypothetical protein [Acetobacter musti]NHN85780.1 hypothetical protein [Acetobacter musti]